MAIVCHLQLPSNVNLVNLFGDIENIDKTRFIGLAEEAYTIHFYE